MCEAQLQFFRSAGKPESVEKLTNVAQTFAILQQRRHTADYDISFDWTRTQARAQAELVRIAFADWRAICEEKQAQDFLLALLFPKAADIMKSAKGDARP